jgi:hypothetical protein
MRSTHPADPRSIGTPRDSGMKTALRKAGRLAGLILLGGVIVLPVLSCRTSAGPDDPRDRISLQLDAVPLLLKADTTGVSTIWATVLISNQPAPDSTLVSFVSTLGTVTSEAFTRDGLARATFTPGSETGAAAVVAQVMAVRDTVVLTVY